MRKGRDPRKTQAQIFPRPTIIFREPHFAVVGAHVQHARLEGRLGNGHDGGILFRTGRVTRDAAGGIHRRIAFAIEAGGDADTRLIAGREIGGNGEGLFPLLHRLEQLVGPRIQHIGIVARQDERRIPVPSGGHIRIGELFLHLGAEIRDPLRLVGREGRAPRPANAGDLLTELRSRDGARLHAHHLTRGHVAPRDVAPLRLVVHVVRIERILRRLQPIGRENGEPVGHLERRVSTAAQPAGGAVILQATAHAVRHLEIVTDAIELAHGHVVQGVVRAPFVPRLKNAGVAAHNEMRGIIGIDPHGMIVLVNPDHASTPRRATVVGKGKVDGHAVHAIGVLRIDANLREVERTIVDGAHPRPRGPAIG